MRLFAFCLDQFRGRTPPQFRNLLIPSRGHDAERLGGRRIAAPIVWAERSGTEPICQIDCNAFPSLWVSVDDLLFKGFEVLVKNDPA